MATRLENHDPEVSLAVRFTGDKPPQSLDDEDGLDEFLSSHGFEYVDGDLGGRKPTADGAGFSDEDSSGKYLVLILMGLDFVNKLCAY